MNYFSSDFNIAMNKLTIKLVVWHAAVLVLALIFWGYGSQISGEVFLGTSFDALAVIYLVVLLTAVALGIALFQQRKWALTLMAVVGLIYLFESVFTPLNLLSFEIFLFLGLYSLANSKSEIHQRNKINIKRIIQHGAWPVVIGIFLFISFAAYQSPSVQELKDAKRLPSQFEVFIRSVVEYTVGTQIQAPSAEKQSIINQVSRETFNRFNNFFKPYFKYAPPAVSFALFLILWGFGWIFIWLSIFLGMLVFWILKKTGVVRIEEKEAKAEALVI